MSLRAILYVASNYLRRLRRFPGALGRLHKNFKYPRAFIKPPSKFRTSVLPRYLRSLGNPQSLVKNIQRAISASNTHSRPNSLLRAYSGLAGSVQLRHQLSFSTEFSLVAINEMSKQREGSWFSGFLSSLNRYPTLPNLTNKSSALVPKELIGTGCNSAVWSAEVVSGADVNEPFLDDQTNNELAVKVLYNYYASVDPQDRGDDPHIPVDVATSVDWVLLHRQLERECELRPSSGHPNIVPLVGHFLDRAPAGSHTVTSTGERPHTEPSPGVSSSSESFTILSQCTNSDFAEPLSKPEIPSAPSRPVWVGAESFPEGFGGQPFTYYLLMPKFSATLDDLLKGTWSPSSEGSSEQDHKSARTKSNDGSGESSAGNGSFLLSEPASFITQTDTTSSSEGAESPSLSEEDVHFGKIDSIEATKTTSTTGDPARLAPTTWTPRRLVLDVDDIVAILAQLFDAVAELERLGVAHRDIKPNNILLRSRPSLSSDQRLKLTRAQISPKVHGHTCFDDKQVLSTDTRFHVALTDFGCAIRTTPKGPENFQSSFLRFLSHLFTPNITPNVQPDVFTHSGNVALLAPEVSVALAAHQSTAGQDCRHLPNLDYSRADLWAVATLVYPLFGQNNPFTDGTLNSTTYSESELPKLPDRAPGVVCWLLEKCLQRDPLARPPAALVADVLHSWCLLRHSCRRRQQNRPCRCPKELQVAPDREFDTVEASVIDLDLSRELERAPQGELTPSLANHLRAFLNVCWAADWLAGPARPPNGLRVSFYRRVTLSRLATCLRTVLREEAARARRVTRSIAAAMGPITFPVQLSSDEPLSK